VRGPRYSFERKEQKGYKEVQQQYWRVDPKQLLDATKLRIHKMKTALHAVHVENFNIYVCNECEDVDGNHPS
jgi:transcription initiation factor IIE alpha subunit